MLDGMAKDMLAGFLHLSGRVLASRGGIERCVRLPLLWSGSLGKVVVAVVAVLPSVDRTLWTYSGLDRQLIYYQTNC